jgi:hypothetical protein
MLETTNDLAAAHGLCGSTRCATASLTHLTQLQLATAFGCGAAASGPPKQLQLTATLRKARGRALQEPFKAEASVISDRLSGCGRVW